MNDEKVKIPTYILEKRNEIEKKMVESGEMERYLCCHHRLEEYLRKKLISAGWKEDLKIFCKGNFL